MQEESSDVPFPKKQKDSYSSCSALVEDLWLFKVLYMQQIKTSCIYLQKVPIYRRQHLSKHKLIYLALKTAQQSSSYQQHFHTASSVT